MTKEGNFVELLPLLAAHRVDFILIGGGAGIAHGLARSTYDVDIVYSRDPDNLQRLADCLAPYNPYLRDMPLGLPFSLDARTLGNGLNFTLNTELGALDLLGDVPGGGGYQELLASSYVIKLFGYECRVVTLEKLIQLKRAAGRPKDLEAIAELQLLLNSSR
ncbi:MAG: hypothetical protein SGI77_15440 [Pirellulaceae bacterium]|nr:hypothetical protein [Pirellulaceae bacterium]